MNANPLNGLYPKYKCPICGDWFHMPWKFCQCKRDDLISTDGTNKSQKEIYEEKDY